MHDIKAIRDNPEAFDEGLRRRGLPARAESLIALDETRRAAILALQRDQQTSNTVSKAIGGALARKNSAEAEQLRAQVVGLKATMPELEAAERKAEKALNDALAEIPNLPLDDTPDGRDENDNVELPERRHGAPPSFPEGFAPKEHFEIGEALGLMDFGAAAKLSGARFVVLKGALARFERALEQFMLDLHTREHGYTEVAPPVLVRDQAMFGTAQLPKFRQDQYFASGETDFTSIDSILDAEGHSAWLIDPKFPDQIKKFIMEASQVSQRDEDDYSRDSHGGSLLFKKFWETFRVREMSTPRWLIPTAEVPLTNLVRESIVDEKALPLRFTAGTLCFRAEAGAAGKDTRGMIRQHQFKKVELVSITTPEQSRDEHERMTACAEEVLKRLGLHFRTVALCTGDIGFASQKTYDIEVWLPGQGRFREISSCSICGDFQARRMNARFKSADAKSTRFVHTLNGSGVAVGRALVAVLENYQEPDGSVVVPEVLRPYMGGLARIEAKM